MNYVVATVLDLVGEVRSGIIVPVGFPSDLCGRHRSVSLILSDRAT